MKINNLKTVIFLLIAGSAVYGMYFYEHSRSQMSPEYMNEISDFRKHAEERLKSPDNWLSLVGLHWLKPGVNTLGSANNNDIVLPSQLPGRFAEITLDSDQKARIRFFTSTDVLLDQKPITIEQTYIIHDDHSAQPTRVEFGSVNFNLIRRANGIGVRLRDNNSENRKNFIAREWYPPTEDFIVTADWNPHSSPKKISVPDILGNLNEDYSPGFAVMQIDGTSIELHPTLSGDQLFFVFRDKTSGRETYGAARYLYTDLPKNGKIRLDFNKAINPPCAFTEFATCPMPIKENIMQVAIRAGELKPARKN